MQLSKLDSGQNNGHYPLLFLFLKKLPDKSDNSCHERGIRQLLTLPTYLI